MTHDSSSNTPKAFTCIIDRDVYVDTNIYMQMQILYIWR